MFYALRPSFGGVWGGRKSQNEKNYNGYIIQTVFNQFVTNYENLMKYLLILLLTVLFGFGFAQDHQSLAPTPPMGWNSWNLVEKEVDEQILKEMADALVRTGMKDAGYQYILVDDYWVGGRDSQNKLFPDPKRFPNGMKVVADYIHSKGLKLGLYSDAGPLTCAGVTGSFGFETIDARTFAEWGIDYLKYDYCNAPEDVETAFIRYKKMGDALKITGRPIVFAICEWGHRKPWLWAKAAGGHLWRTGGDSRDVWQSNNQTYTGIMEIFDAQEGLEQYAGPTNGWNDPDLLMVGLYGQGKSSSLNGRYKGCTTIEYRSHFALWCMLAAPLIVNLDIRRMDTETSRLLLNQELIAIDQDKHGKQGYTLFRQGNLQILKKELEGDDVAICIFNRSSEVVPFDFKVQKDLKVWFPLKIKDISNHKEWENEKRVYGELKPHECVVYRLHKLEQKN